jgi:2-polyprenyl-3-methyl-5-hydroxy-6-metoxy-1,4-benzoquinol methylase
MKHVEDVKAAYTEIDRVLKPGGSYLFLTPNRYDYASIVAHIVPNGLHATIVKRTEGREKIDTFPTFYRSNTETAIRALA